MGRVADEQRCDGGMARLTVDAAMRCAPQEHDLAAHAGPFADSALRQQQTPRDRQQDMRRVPVEAASGSHSAASSTSMLPIAPSF